MKVSESLRLNPIYYLTMTRLCDCTHQIRTLNKSAIGCAAISFNEMRVKPK